MGAVLVGLLVVALGAGWLWQRAQRSRLQARVRDLELHPERAGAGVPLDEGSSLLAARLDDEHVIRAIAMRRPLR